MKLQNKDFNSYFYQYVTIPFVVVVVVVKKLKANNFNFNQVPDYNISKIVNTNKLK